MMTNIDVTLMEFSIAMVVFVGLVGFVIARAVIKEESK